jgi:hypothetical protein
MMALLLALDFARTSNVMPPALEIVSLRPFVGSLRTF